MTVSDTAGIVECLQHAVPQAAFEAMAAVDQPTIAVSREHAVETWRALRDDPALRYTLLADVTAVDWLDREPRFDVIYHLASPGSRGAPRRLRITIRVPAHEARVPTASTVWPCADWLEREVWDLFGIVFDGHPDLRRLLMPDEWEGHPLRKDYPVQVRVAAASREPLQVSRDEFLANIEAARRGSTPGGSRTRG